MRRFRPGTWPEAGIIGACALALMAWTSGCGDDDGGVNNHNIVDAHVYLDAQTQMDAQTQADAQTQSDADVPDPFEVTERVEVVTSMGTFVVALYGVGAPVTVANFLTYVDAGAFTDIIFHRVIADFMIQGGGLYSDMTMAPSNAPIPLEILAGLSHQPGVISMARTSNPNSATRQFFICVADDSFLDGDYAAFGTVESGYDIVEAISLVQTQTVGSYDDVPVTPVVIQSVTRLGAP